jgi:DNA-binding NarL/FixJ family response regulator
MRQAEELRRAIQELEARKQAMLAIMLPKVSSEETMSVNSKVATEELTAVDKLQVDREVDIDKQILELACQGKSLRQIAEITKLSHEGVRRRLKRLQSKPVG